MGHRVEYFSMNKFIERIALAKLDGSLLKVINHIERNDLVIFDDFGAYSAQRVPGVAEYTVPG